MDEPCKRFGGSFQCGILRNIVRTHFRNEFPSDDINLDKRSPREA